MRGKSLVQSAVPTRNVRGLKAVVNAGNVGDSKVLEDKELVDEVAVGDAGTMPENNGGERRPYRVLIRRKAHDSWLALLAICCGHAGLPTGTLDGCYFIQETTQEG
jgi:hypothetical protein